VEQKLGTGAMITSAKSGEVDVILALTEGLVAGTAPFLFFALRFRFVLLLSPSVAAVGSRATCGGGVRRHRERVRPAAVRDLRAVAPVLGHLDGPGLCLQHGGGHQGPGAHYNTTTP
jgi:hypothetical protein